MYSQRTAEKAIRIFLPFPNMCLCEAGFSSTTSAKATYDNTTSAEAAMRIDVSSIEPETKEICKNVNDGLLLTKCVLENNSFLGHVGGSVG